jgi:carboxyl-terminal processing protease
LPGTPAERSGVESGDYIVGIVDAEKGVEKGTFGISLQEAVGDIRGPAGSRVTLLLMREGKEDPLEVELTREKIEVPSVSLEMVGEGEKVAHISVLKFGGETLNEWNEVVSDVLKEGVLRGIVVDLRGNPGGYLQGAVDLGSEFLEVGDVVVLEQRGRKKTEFYVERQGRFLGERVVVLVDGGSASASEILAGALRDQLGVMIVGERTFGKGTIQERQEIEGGVALHVTSAKWLTPNEVWVNEVGLEPDFEIEDDIETSQDEQLERALEFLSEGV